MILMALYVFLGVLFIVSCTKVALMRLGCCAKRKSHSEGMIACVVILLILMFVPSYLEYDRTKEDYSIEYDTYDDRTTAEGKEYASLKADEEELIYEIRHAKDNGLEEDEIEELNEELEDIRVKIKALETDEKAGIAIIKICAIILVATEVALIVLKKVLCPDITSDEKKYVLTGYKKIKD